VGADALGRDVARGGRGRARGRGRRLDAVAAMSKAYVGRMLALPPGGRLISITPPLARPPLSCCPPPPAHPPLTFSEEKSCKATDSLTRAGRHPDASTHHKPVPIERVGCGGWDVGLGVGAFQIRGLGLASTGSQRQRGRRRARAASGCCRLLGRLVRQATATCRCLSLLPLALDMTRTHCCRTPPAPVPCGQVTYGHHVFVTYRWHEVA